jgi:hypothetical protein
MFCCGLSSHAIRDNRTHTFLNGPPVFVGRKVPELLAVFPTRQHFYHELKIGCLRRRIRVQGRVRDLDFLPGITTSVGVRLF